MISIHHTPFYNLLSPSTHIHDIILLPFPSNFCFHPFLCIPLRTAIILFKVENKCISNGSSTAIIPVSSKLGFESPKDMEIQYQPKNLYYKTLEILASLELVYNHRLRRFLKKTLKTTKIRSQKNT